jgi:ligand-binding SRPBCC domain-containing protein
MFTISDSVHIHAPIERCFLLSTSVPLTARTWGMRPIEGRTEGALESGDRVVWGGWKLALPQMHETVITGYQRPEFYQETMGRGRFRRFQYDHQLTEIDGHTLLNDKIRLSLPLGPIGQLVAHHIVVPYLCRSLRQRLLALKKLAEGEEWRRYLPEDKHQTPQGQHYEYLRSSNHSEI